MLSDLKFAFRSLAKSPGFTAVALATLALGLGMNTAMFSMLNGFLLRPLDYPHPEQLFRLDRVTPQQPQGDHAPANVVDLFRESADFAQLAAFRYWGFTLTEPNQPAEMPFALRVSANYFDVLGFPPEFGRTFQAQEDVEGKNNVIIISHNYWQKRFGGAPDTLGRTVRIDGTPVQIVGILPAHDDATRLTGLIDVYRPMGFSAVERAYRLSNDVGVIGRLRDGVTPGQATAQFAALAHRLAKDHPAENANLDLRIRSLQSTSLSGVGRTITFLLIGLSGFVLLIACGNLANLLLARAIARGREFSIRGALGASPVDLVRPLAAECLVLAVAGGLGATLVSVWTSAWLARRFGSPDNPADFSVDGRVVLFTLALSVFTALLFGVAPAWWAARMRSMERGSSPRIKRRVRISFPNRGHRPASMRSASRSEMNTLRESERGFGGPETSSMTNDQTPSRSRRTSQAFARSAGKSPYQGARDLLAERKSAGVADR
jgi:predicted permease